MASGRAIARDWLPVPRTVCNFRDRSFRFRAMTCFVVADMGGWVRSKGRLLLLDPSLPPERRTKVLLDRIDYPFGLAIGVRQESLQLHDGNDLPFRAACSRTRAHGRNDRAGLARA